jgi:hypothetical protein
MALLCGLEGRKVKPNPALKRDAKSAAHFWRHLALLYAP